MSKPKPTAEEDAAKSWIGKSPEELTSQHNELKTDEAIEGLDRLMPEE